MQKSFNFVGNLKKFAIASCAIMLVGLIASVILGPKLSINFSGGTKISYSFTGDINTDDVEAIFKDTIKLEAKADISTDISGNTKKLNVSLADNKALSTERIDSLLKALQKKYTDNSVEQVNVQSVSSTAGVKTFVKSLIAVVIAALLILIYVAIRFRNIGGWTAGLAAIVALVHDVLIAFIVCVVFRFSIDNNFIAVVLTLFGYSLNSTIVAFDRIRENRRLNGNSIPLADLVNDSLSQILRRTVVTTLTTFLAIATVAVVAEIMGLTTLHSLTVPMAVGLVSGAYSSVCIAPALWVKWQSLRKPKSGKKSRAMV